MHHFLSTYAEYTYTFIHKHTGATVTNTARNNMADVFIYLPLYLFRLRKQIWTYAVGIVCANNCVQVLMLSLLRKTIQAY